MIKVAKGGFILAFVFVFSTYPIVWFLSKNAVSAYIIVGKDPQLVETEKAIFDPPTKDKASPEYRRAVMNIYGMAVDEPTPVLFVAQDKFLKPQELPTITLLPVNKEKGENPFQVKTLWFFARWVMRGAAAVAFVLYVLWRVLIKRAAAKAQAA